MEKYIAIANSSVIKPNYFTIEAETLREAIWKFYKIVKHEEFEDVDLIQEFRDLKRVNLGYYTLFQLKENYEIG